MIALLALAASPAFKVDGKPVDVGPIEFSLDAYVAPLGPTVKALSKGTVEFRRDSPVRGSLVGSNGKVLMTLPIDNGRTLKDPYAHVVGVPGDVPVGTTPYESETDKNVILADVQEVAGWVGAGLDASPDGFEATSAAMWEALLGLPHREGPAPADLAQDLGVSPPALTMVVWARTHRPAWVQIYGLNGDSGPEPMLGIDLLTQKPATGTEGIAPQPRHLDKDESVRVPTQHGRNKVGETGYYAALFLRNDPGAQDPLAAIAAGKIGPDDYAVVGIRQRIGASPVVFKTILTKPGESLVDLAKRNSADLALIRALNGLVPDETVPPNTRLVLPEAVKPLAPPASLGDYQATNYYAKRGDTVKALAAKWKAPLDDALSVNPGLEADTPLQPGEILTQIVPKAAPGGALPPAPKKPSIGVATLAAPTQLRRDPTSAPSDEAIPRGYVVEVLDKVGGFYRVVYKEHVGFLPAASVKDVDIDEDKPVRLPPQFGGADPRPVAVDPSVSPVVREALRYYGTPYKWGGASLARGIDCSHFVSAVYNEVNLRCPEPPVTNQERLGQPVHWKAPGVVVMRGSTQVAMPTTQPSFARLRPGDRFIVQRGLTDASGSRHTGIYAGRLSYRGRNYTNAVIHASCSRGITVDELTQSWMWKDYKFSLPPLSGGGR